MSKRKGQLIIFEGIDHVGKSTVSKAIYDELLKKEIPCVYYSFPGKQDGTLGKIVYELHHDRGGIPTSSINPISLQILHIAAHIDALERDILPDIRNGKIVILDRFWWSTYAYGAGDGISDKILQQIILPEVSLLCDVHEIQYIYIKRKQRENDFSKEKSMKVLQAYEFLCEKFDDANLLVIDNDDAIEETISKVIDFIVHDEVGR